MTTTLNEFGALMALLGHLGQNGRRPRELEASVVGADPDGGYMITGLNGSSVVIPGVPALNSYVPAPQLPERVRLSMVQYSATIAGSYQ